MRAPSYAIDHHRSKPSPEPIFHRATKRPWTIDRPLMDNRQSASIDQGVFWPRSRTFSSHPSQTPIATLERVAHALPTETEFSAAASVSLRLNMPPHKTQFRHTRRWAILTLQPAARSSDCRSSAEMVLHADKFDGLVAEQPNDGRGAALSRCHPESVPARSTRAPLEVELALWSRRSRSQMTPSWNSNKGCSSSLARSALHAPKIVEELTVQRAPGGESGMILSYVDLIGVRQRKLSGLVSRGTIR